MTPSGVEPLESRVFTRVIKQSTNVPDTLEHFAFQGNRAIATKTQELASGKVGFETCYKFERRSSDSLRMTVMASRTISGQTTVATEGNGTTIDATMELSADGSTLYSGGGGTMDARLVYSADSTMTAASLLARCDEN